MSVSITCTYIAPRWELHRNSNSHQSHSFLFQQIQSITIKWDWLFPFTRFNEMNYLSHHGMKLYDLIAWFYLTLGVIPTLNWADNCCSVKSQLLVFWGNPRRSPTLPDTSSWLPISIIFLWVDPRVGKYLYLRGVVHEKSPIQYYSIIHIQVYMLICFYVQLILF